MKNAKKIGIALLMIVVITVGVVFAVMAADGYTGDVEKFADLVDKATKADTITTKEEALTAVEKYITSKPVDPESEGYAEVAAAYQTAKVDIINMYLAEIAKDGTAIDTKISYAAKSDKWYVSAFRNEAGAADPRLAATLAATHASNMQIAQTLFEAVNAEDLSGSEIEAANAMSGYKRAKSFYDQRVFDDTKAEYTTLGEKIAELTALYKAGVNARYLELTSQARMADYTAKALMNNNFEGAVGLPTLSNYKGYKDGAAFNHTHGKETEILPDGSTNTYYAVHFNDTYKETAETTRLSPYFTLEFGGVVDRFIMEFDMTSFSTLQNSTIHFQSRPSEGTNTWFSINSKGDIIDHNSKVIAEKVIVPGEWTHISLVCEMSNINKSRLYVDYAFVGYVMGDHKGYGYTPANMRVGNSANYKGEMCFDNMYIGLQSSFCNKNFLEAMNSAEKFAYYVDYMQRTGNDEIFIKIPDCVEAYNSATNLVSQFGYQDENGAITYTQSTEGIQDPILKEKVKQAVIEYFDYDPWEIIFNYRLANLREYRIMIEALVGSAKAPTSTSISNRNGQVSDIEVFVDANGEYILKAGNDYKEITEGSGLADDPFILNYGDHPLTYGASYGGGWAYYKYVATEFGIFTFSAPGEHVVIARGVSKDSIAQLGEQSTRMIVHPGDEVWFGVKTDDGSVAADSIAVSAKIERVIAVADTVQYVIDGNGTTDNPYLLYHVNNTLTHSISYAKSTVANTYKYYLYEAKQDGVITLSLSSSTFSFVYGPSLDELCDTAVTSATFEVTAGEKIYIRVGNPKAIGSSAVTMSLTATATRGTGTAESPYIIDRANNTLAYNAEGEWAYYKYTVTESGILSFSASGAVIGKGYSLDKVSSLDYDSTEFIVSKGEVIWFGVKTSDGSDASIKVSCVLNAILSYDDILNTYSAEVDRIAQDKAILNFNSVMDILDGASSAILLQSKYNAASELIAEGLNTDLLDEPGYKHFNKHYTVTYVNAPSKINQAIMDSNSKSLIMTINYITERYPNEADWYLVYIENATTPEELANNETYLFIENYVNLIRERIDDGMYNPYYVLDDGTSIDMAISRFQGMNDYYYSILQGKHVAAIGAQFEIFASSSSFIEKQGIISYIQRYLNKQNVDFYVELTCENEACTAYDVLYKGAVKDVARPACTICDQAVSEYRISSDRAELYTILKKYTAYLAELAPQAENYEEMLNQNTIYFVNAVKRFDTAITFEEKYALLNEAMPYYYSMNISSEDVKEAIRRYDALAAELDAVEQASREFVRCVITDMPAARAEYGEDGYYAKLVEASVLFAGVDVSVQGVEGLADAIAQYEAELAAYKTLTETANSEIAQATGLMGSFGSTCGFTAVLSVVLKELLSFAN